MPCSSPLATAEKKELEEQRVCMNLIFKLGKSATETFGMIQQAFVKKAMGRGCVLSGSVVLYRAEPRQMKSNERGGLPHRQTPTMSNW